MGIAASMPWQNIEYKACFDLHSGMHIEASTGISNIYSFRFFVGLPRANMGCTFVTEVFLIQDPALLD